MAEPFLDRDLRVTPIDAFIDPSRPGAGDHHARAWRPCALRPRRGAGDARHDRHHEDALRRGLRRAASRRSTTARRSKIDGVTITFYPAGHILGSAQVLMEHQGQRIVVTGDYKRLPDRTAQPFELVAVRPARDRGDVRAAGVPASRPAGRDRAAAALGGRASRARARHRLLCAGQGAAGDLAAARRPATTRRSTSTAR